MRNFRKIISFCMALVLLLSLAAGAAAQSTTLADGTQLTIATPEGGNMTVEIKRPAGSAGTMVTIPMAKQPGVSTVAMQVLLDGSKKVVLPSFSTPDGLQIFVQADCKLEIVDNAKPLADVVGGTWYFNSVQFVASRELLGGVTENTFAPDLLMTRQMLWMVLARLGGAAPEGYEQAKKWAVEAGLTDGTNPTANVTREQLVATLYRYAQKQGKGLIGDFMINMSQYQDLNQVSSWAKEAFVWAKINNVAGGTSETMLSPKANATRAQVAKMVEGLVSSLYK